MKSPGQHQQRGVTLVVTLIMLVVLTLLAFSAINSSNTNLRIAGNMQRQYEAQRAAERVIDNFLDASSVLSSSAVSDSVDVNGDGVADFTVSMTRACIAEPVSKATSQQNLPQAPLQVGNVVDRPGATTVGGAAPTAGAPGVRDSLWEMTATATDVSSGTKAIMHQGISVLAQRCP